MATSSGKSARGVIALLTLGAIAGIVFIFLLLSRDSGLSGNVSSEFDLSDPGVGAISADGSLIANWVGDMADHQPLVAAWIGDEAVDRVSGTLVLTPGPKPADDDLPGGVFFHVYAKPEVLKEGGRDAQIGMLNSDPVPTIDGASGICVTDACHGTGKDYTHEGVFDDIDASQGLEFDFTHNDGVLTLNVTPVATPDITYKVASHEFPGGINAISLNIWGTTRPFTAEVQNLSFDS